jgi:hypothetical protein
MIYKFNHVLPLVFGIALAACGGDPETPTGTTYSANIQKDAIALGCTAVGCHNATSTTKLKIDPTAGKEQANYDALFTNQLVVKGDPATSALIQVPKTGKATSGASHVTTLTGTKLTSWNDWVTAQAPF